MNKIYTFHNENYGSVRVLTAETEPLFSAADILNAIGCTDRKEQEELIARVCKKTETYGTFNPEGEKEVITMIPADDVWRIVDEKGAGGTPFDHWIDTVVLPEIKDKYHIANRFIDHYFPDATSHEKIIIRAMLDVIEIRAKKSR